MGKSEGSDKGGSEKKGMESVPMLRIRQPIIMECAFERIVFMEISGKDF